MAIAYQDIAAFMDPVHPPTSMRELARIHRWSNGAPPDPLSFRALGERHTGPSSRTLRFLHYNAFFIPGFEIPLDMFDLAKTLATLGLDPAVVVAKAFTAADITLRLGANALEIVSETLSLSTIAERLGVSLGILGDISDIGGDVVTFISGGTISVTSAVLQLLEAAGLDALGALEKLLFTPMDILRYLELDPLQALIRAGFGVAELLGAEIPSTIAMGDAPIRPERAAELAEKLVAEGYGIAALNEVYEPEVLSLLATELAGRGVVPDFELGSDELGDDKDPDERRFLGSGLLTIGLQAPLRRETPIRDRRRIFKSRGDELSDVDAWSNKGVLLTVVDVGLGQLDVYSTHTMFGGSLIPRQTLRKVANLFSSGAPMPEIDEDAFRIGVRLAQVAELVDFFNETHDPQHVAVISGDFNLKGDVDPQSDRTYGPLIERLSHTTTRDGTPTVMEDVWALQGGGKTGFGLHGNTNNNHHDLTPVCARRDISRSEALSRFGTFPVEPSFYYCDDDQPPPDPLQGDGRIDYVFVERPLATHTFTLDMSRMRRRPFERTKPSAAARFLSDHIGLDMSLLISPVQ